MLSLLTKMHEGSFPTGRFHLNLDAVKEECSSNVLLDVQVLMKVLNLKMLFTLLILS